MHTMSTFFTSDCHFGHANIIKHCQRPFASAAEMNEALISRWNAVVGQNDTVWVLGDIAFRQSNGTFPGIFYRLKGIKHLIRGNHDNDEVLAQPWASVSDYKEINLHNKKLVLSHYPMRSWNGMFKGALHLYGHCHGNIDDYSNCVDVGVDRWDYTPVTLARIQQHMSTLTQWKPKG